MTENQQCGLPTVPSMRLWGQLYFLPPVFHLQKEESYEIGSLTKA